MLAQGSGYRSSSRHNYSDFWRSWDNCTGLACDKIVFEDIKEKLSFGILYFSYYPPPYSHEGKGFASHALSLPSILTHMYPITVRDIRPGTISGDERVITLHSGAFGFPDKLQFIGDQIAPTATLWCYDSHGAVQAPKPVVAAGPRSSFSVVVPVDGACVLERASSPLMAKHDDDGDDDARSAAGYAYKPWKP